MQKIEFVELIEKEIAFYGKKFKTIEEKKYWIRRYYDAFDHLSLEEITNAFRKASEHHDLFPKIAQLAKFAKPKRKIHQPMFEERVYLEDGPERLKAIREQLKNS